MGSGKDGQLTFVYNLDVERDRGLQASWGSRRGGHPLEGLCVRREGLLGTISGTDLGEAGSGGVLGRVEEWPEALGENVQCLREP